MADSLANTIDGTIEKIENDQATIVIHAGQKVQWPISHLPNDIQVGSTVELIIRTPGVSDHQIAKSMLNEILN